MTLMGNVFTELSFNTLPFKGRAGEGMGLKFSFEGTRKRSSGPFLRRMGAIQFVPRTVHKGVVGVRLGERI